MPEQRKNLSRDKMNRLRGMPAGGFVVCDFVVCGFVVCGFVVCGTGGACDVEMGEKEERTGAQKNRLPSRAACSFLSSEFSSAGIFRVPRRWLSAGDGSTLEIAQRCLAMSGFAQCRPLCGAVLRCFLSGATPANGQISIALALEQAALRWPLCGAVPRWQPNRA